MTIEKVLSSTIAQMRMNACHARHQPVYEAARANRSEFESYPDLSSVLTALRTEHEDSRDTREALTRLLLLEHRARQSQVWVHALFAAYGPMLYRLRCRVVCSWSKADIDQVVLSSFAEALDKVQVENDGPHCAFRLRQCTARLVFQRLRGDHDDQQAELLGERCFKVTNEHAAAWAPDAGVDCGSSAEEVLRAAGEDAELLRATVLEGESLQEYVKRTVDGDEETRRRAYDRLRFQRARALAKLRASPRLRRAVAA
jgi:hypothetical protein